MNSNFPLNRLRDELSRNLVVEMSGLQKSNSNFDLIPLPRSMEISECKSRIVPYSFRVSRWDRFRGVISLISPPLFRTKFRIGSGEYSRTSPRYLPGHIYTAGYLCNFVCTEYDCRVGELMHLAALCSTCLSQRRIYIILYNRRSRQRILLAKGLVNLSRLQIPRRPVYVHCTMVLRLLYGEVYL